jgi:hypothetical protein
VVAATGRGLLADDAVDGKIAIIDSLTVERDNLKRQKSTLETSMAASVRVAPNYWWFAAR